MTVLETDTRTMRAIGIRGYGSPEVLEPLELSRPALGHDTVLIRVVAAGVNPADTALRSGRLRFVARSKFPFVPGADIAGIVEAVGPSVRRFRPGDAVYAMLPNLAGGGYAEYAATSERNVAAAPANITFAEAAATPLTGLTALQALCEKAQLKPGAAVLINGASGGVGSFAVQIAKVLGARVTAVSSGRNADFARNLGADDVLNYTTEDVTNAKSRYDVIIDAVNAYPLWRWWQAVRQNGVAITTSPAPWNMAFDRLTRLAGGRRLGSLLVRPDAAGLQTLRQWIAEGQVRPVVDRCYTLDQAAEAHRYIESRRARGKLVLVVDEGLATTKAAAVQRVGL